MTKQEQLKKAFKRILTKVIDEVNNFGYADYVIDKKIIETTTNMLLKEVSIRTPLK